jgi:hypothetical protein
MALSNLAHYDASYRESDDNVALERAGREWASVAGYDPPYDVCGVIGRLQVLAGKGRRWDAKRGGWVVSWNAANEMHRVAAPYRRPDPDPAEAELAPEQRASVPARRVSRRLGIPSERMLMREVNEKLKREREDGR